MPHTTERADPAARKIVKTASRTCTAATRGALRALSPRTAAATAQRPQDRSGWTQGTAQNSFAPVRNAKILMAFPCPTDACPGRAECFATSKDQRRSYEVLSTCRVYEATTCAGGVRRVDLDSRSWRTCACRIFTRTSCTRGHVPTYFPCSRD